MKHAREETIRCICGWVGHGYGGDPCPACGSTSRKYDMTLIDADKLKKMRVCAPLLPAPGPEVVLELLNHIDALTKERDAWKRRAILHGCLDKGDPDCG